VNINKQKNHELYEEFHRNTVAQKRIPRETDFSMVNHLSLYAKYINEGKKILDIGCGAAPFSIYAANKGAIVKGIDLSEKAIKENNKAKEYLEMENLSFQNEDFMEYIDEAIYDLVMLTEVLEHLPNDKLALIKINSLLKENGHLLMSVPSINAPLHKKYLKKYGRDPFDERVGHLRRYTGDGIKDMLQDTGFQVLEIKLCEGYLRNWLFNDDIGRFFMKFNRSFISRIVTILDDKIFTPIWGESDIIIVAKKV
jgi:SAM-dependent methyltransferase